MKRFKVEKTAALALREPLWGHLQRIKKRIKCFNRGWGNAARGRGGEGGGDGERGARGNREGGA